MTWNRSWRPTRPVRTGWPPAQAPVLAAVLRAFDPAETDSRLLVTSRFTFTLDGLQARLEPVQLRPLSPVAQRKLQRRQQALTPAERLAERAGLAARALTVSRGNPGLQDLIGLRLVYGEQVSAGPRRGRGRRAWKATSAKATCPPMLRCGRSWKTWPWTRCWTRPGPPNVALLRAATLFDVPVPEPVIEALAGQVGGSAGPAAGPGTAGPLPGPVRPGPYRAGRQPAGHRAGSTRSARPGAGRSGRGSPPGRCLPPGAARRHRPPVTGCWMCS